MTTAYANLIILMKTCEMYFSTQNSWVPLGKVAMRDLSEAMSRLCGDSVTIEFRTDKEHMQADISKFTRRLATVEGWEFGEWHHPVIDGFTISTKLECVGTRKPGQKSANQIEAAEEIAVKNAELSRLESSGGTGHDIRRINRLRSQIEELECAK